MHEEWHRDTQGNTLQLPVYVLRSTCNFQPTSWQYPQSRCQLKIHTNRNLQEFPWVVFQLQFPLAPAKVETLVLYLRSLAHFSTPKWLTLRCFISSWGNTIPHLQISWPWQIIGNSHSISQRLSYWVSNNTKWGHLSSSLARSNSVACHSL